MFVISYGLIIFSQIEENNLLRTELHKKIQELEKYVCPSCFFLFSYCSCWTTAFPFSVIIYFYKADLFYLMQLINIFHILFSFHEP